MWGCGVWGSKDMELRVGGGGAGEHLWREPQAGQSNKLIATLYT